MFIKQQRVPTPRSRSLTLMHTVVVDGTCNPRDFHKRVILLIRGAVFLNSVLFTQGSFKPNLSRWLRLVKTTYT